MNEKMRETDLATIRQVMLEARAELGDAIGSCEELGPAIASRDAALILQRAKDLAAACGAAHMTTAHLENLCDEWHDGGPVQGEGEADWLSRINRSRPVNDNERSDEMDINEREEAERQAYAARPVPDAATVGRITYEGGLPVQQFVYKLHSLMNEENSNSAEATLNEVADAWAVKLGPNHQVVRRLYMAIADLHSARNLMREAAGTLRRQVVKVSKEEDARLRSKEGASDE